MEMISNYIDEYKIDGVVDVVLQSCHTYNMESSRVKSTVNEKETPFLHLETDYSEDAVGQITTRIQAFIEML